MIPGNYILDKLKIEDINAESLIKAFIRTSVPMILIHRATGSIMDVNQSTLEFYGYSYDEILQMHISDFDVKSKIEVKDVYRRLLEGEEHFEFNHKKANGSISTIYARMTLFNMDHDTYILVFFDDITKANSEENQQKYELSRYNQFLNNTKSGVVFLDPYDRIIEMNERFMEIFKVGKEVLGKPINDVVVDDLLRKEADDLSIVGFSGNKFDINTVRVKSDGTHFNVNVQVIPIFFKNRLTGVYGVYTELNHPEFVPVTTNDTLYENPSDEYNLHLHARLSTLNDLANKISHEINTPLGISITGSTYMSRIITDVIKTMEQPNVSKKYIRDNLKDLNDSTELITNNLGYIKNTIDLIKEISYDLVYDYDEVHLKDEIQTIIGHMKEITRDLKNTIEIQCSSPVIKRISKTLLRNIISNLVENAIYHGADDWDTFKIILKIENINDRIIITVEDNGKGMSPETTQKIFDPFYSGSKLGDHYLGLGLSIVYNIVTFFMDGTIRVESKLGFGSQFVITI